MPLLYEQICDHIIEEIATDQLRPGDQLPTEQEYAARFRVSRITIRRAMSQLQEEGLIERFRGRGTFVTQRAPALASLERAQPAPSPPDGDVAPRGRRIGFIVPEISDLFGVMMLNGIDERCQECGIDLSIRRSHGSIEIEARTISTWIDAGLDGIIIFPSHGEFYNQTLLRAVFNGFPVVLVDRDLAGIPVPSVMTNHFEASRTITRWLLAQGNGELAFVSPTPAGTSSLEERQRGFLEALQAENPPRSGVTLILDSVVPGQSSTESYARDRQLIRAFLEEHPQVTAMLASEYGVALLVDSVVRNDPAFADRQVEIACFDSLVEFMNVRTFPHIRQDETGIGRYAVDLMLDQWRGEHPTGRRYVDFALVTGCSPSDEMIY